MFNFEGFDGMIKKWFLILIPIYITIIGLVGWVAYHFIHKYW